MPGSQFDDVVTIAGQDIVATGPLRQFNGVLPKGTTREVYVWLVQSKAGEPGVFVQTKGIPDGDAKWTTKGQPSDKEGKLEPGPALGLAVEITTEPGGEPKVHFWSEMISLQAGTSAATQAGTSAAA